MSKITEFGCLPTAIGTMPHKDTQESLRIVLRYLSAIPAWPQLPARSFRENMYAQFSEGFPGAVVDESGHVTLDRTQDIDTALERLHLAYMNREAEAYDTSRDYAAGLHALLEAQISPVAVKGQITGPISWGLSVTDEGRYAIYDDGLAEAMARHLALKATWQEKALARISPATIVFVDEPYLTSLGTAFVSLPTDKVTGLLTETLSGIGGLKGIHCCGSTDWSLILGLPIDILSFDAYNYAESLSAYDEPLRSFVARGGVIAWGIVPNDEDYLAKESPATLKDRLEETIAGFVTPDLSFRQLVTQSILTPSCGLATLPVEGADQALGYLADLSAAVRSRYVH